MLLRISFLQSSIQLYFSKGPYKRSQTAAHRQAKFYLPRQASAPQRLIYCGNIYSCYGRSRRATVDEGKKSLLATASHLLRRFLFNIDNFETKEDSYYFVIYA